MRTVRWIGLALALVGGQAAAQGVHVEVVKTGLVKTPVTLTGIRHADRESERRFVQTLQNDLQLSGWFQVQTSLDGGGVALTGSCETKGERLDVRLRVAGWPAGPVYLERGWTGTPAEARRLAHAVADDIVWAVRKVRGIASTRLVMVRRQGNQRDVYVADADGGNLTRLTQDGAICLAPVWAPGGRGIIYTSYHKGYPDIYRIDLASMRRERLVAFPGTNLNGGVCPEGRRLALSLSKDGNPDLYVLDLVTRRVTRLTATPHAAEASTSWAPDGRQLVYVAGSGGSSRRLGAPQLFVMDAGGGAARQITFRGSENVAPDWGPDGRIAYSSRREGRYRICLFDPRSGEHAVVTTENRDHEDPSWARNARHLACSVIGPNNSKTRIQIENAFRHTGENQPLFQF